MRNACGPSPKFGNQKENEGGPWSKINLLHAHVGLLSESGDEGPVADHSAQLLWDHILLQALWGTAPLPSIYLLTCKLYPQSKYTANPLKIRSRLTGRETGCEGNGREWGKVQDIWQVIIIRDFLPVYPSVAACKPVGLLCMCSGVTEVCCSVGMNTSPLQNRGRGSHHPHL